MFYNEKKKKITHIQPSIQLYLFNERIYSASSFLWHYSFKLQSNKNNKNEH